MPDGAARRATGKPPVQLGAGVEKHATAAAALLKALGNEQRLLVLCVLLEGPHSVGDINARVSLSQSALSQHLAVLRKAGIVRTRRESQTIWYELSAGPAHQVMQALYAAFCAPRGSARKASRRDIDSAQG